MSLKHLLISGLILLSASSAVTAGTVYTRTHAGGLSLADSGLTVAASTTESVLTIPDATIIDTLTLRIIYLTHSYVSDLHISLIAPDDTPLNAADNPTVLVSFANGGSGHDIVDMWIDQRSTNIIQNGYAPFTGVFEPDNSMAPFIGMSALGDWRLSIYDNSPGDQGVLYQWALAVNEPIPEPSTMAMLLIAAGGLVAARLRRRV